MKTITFTEFRKNASNLLSDVENGEVVRVLRHGRPIAEITPILRQEDVPSWKRPGLRIAAKGAGLSSAILEERKL
jgi:prevent-host-death family protein